jgi:succinate dehydrogenase / fumarate reductase membrane anchor subunit
VSALRAGGGGGRNGGATAPGAAPPRPAPHPEFYSWYFLRLSGLLLIFLALGHFLLMHVVHSILEVDYAFAARRWAEPLWRVYDWLLLVLALLHGFNGLRVVINEWVRPPALRRLARAVAGAAAAAFLLLGTYVLVAFRGPV